MAAQAKDKRMDDAPARPGRLGRGLAALIGDMGPEPSASAPDQQPPKRVPIAFLKANPRNPRKAFAQEQIADLANSIREKGIIQPIIVRPGASADEYEIVAGERRWRAAQKAGLHDVPVIIHALNDQEALEIAIVENVQRADLDPIEEAMGYQQLLSEFSYTQEALAKVIGKSRPHVANTIRLLKLPESVQAHLRSGELTAGHARTLINSDDPERLAELMIKQGLNVREAENVTRKGDAKPKGGGGGAQKDADTLALEKALGDALGLHVSISHRGETGGDVRVTYKTLEQLDLICKRLKGS